MRCYVMVGGESRRIGTRKSELEIGGCSFFDRVRSAAAPLFDEVVAVDRVEGRDYGVRTIFDLEHDAGAPIYGVERALQDAAGEPAWIIATDYPLMTTPVLDFLMQSFITSGADLLVPSAGGRLHMLCAGYSGKMHDVVRRAIAAGQLQLRSLSNEVTTVVIEDAALAPLASPEVFANVNTPEEYDRLRGRYEKNANEPALTHVDSAGGVSMVDVGAKAASRREAGASARVRMSPATLRLVSERALPKGDVLTTAKIAGIFAAKQTSALIPLTHPLALSHVDVQFEVGSDEIVVRSTVRCEGKTGVEIEAMTACAIAALTIYDMCKSAEKGITITQLRLEHKSGGKSGLWKREE
jgi:cyclic pyranopterin monophosphate synthase